MVFALTHYLLQVATSLELFAGSATSIMSRAAFTNLLKTGTITRPHADVLDTVERFYSHRMMACSSLEMAEEVYRAAESIPGASTTKCFVAQHGLKVWKHSRIWHG